MSAELEKEDKIIAEFLQSIGPWKKHIVIGGGYAPIIYKLYFADQQAGNSPVGTRDIDSLLPRTIPKVSQNNIATHLKDSGFKQFYKNYESPPIEAYVKEINGLEIEIEFLTDASTRKDKHKNVFISGVIAQPLSYLKLSIQKSKAFTTRSNITGLVVSPGAWMFHKGLTFPRRNNKNKAYKDLYGVWYVGTQLGKFSNEAIIELYALKQQHTKWFKTFERNFLMWMEHSAPIDWIHLETQDPNGKLSKPNFKRLIKTLIEGERDR